MSDTIKVQVTGIGSSVTVEVPVDACVEDALTEAGVDAEAQGLNVSANGERAESTAPVSDGDQITATPREAKLG